MNDMIGTYYYQFQIGTAEFSRFGLDDRSTRVLLNRWLALFWDTYRANSRKGSMADATNNGWYNAPCAIIVRRYCDSAECPIIPCVDPTVVERFTVCPESRAEFDRLYRM